MYGKCHFYIVLSFTICNLTSLFQASLKFMDFSTVNISQGSNKASCFLLKMAKCFPWDFYKIVVVDDVFFWKKGTSSWLRALTFFYDFCGLKLHFNGLLFKKEISLFSKKRNNTSGMVQHCFPKIFLQKSLWKHKDRSFCNVLTFLWGYKIAVLFDKQTF